MSTDWPWFVLFLWLCWAATAGSSFFRFFCSCNNCARWFSVMAAIPCFSGLVDWCCVVTGSFSQWLAGLPPPIYWTGIWLNNGSLLINSLRAGAADRRRTGWIDHIDRNFNRFHFCCYRHGWINMIITSFKNLACVLSPLWAKLWMVVTCWSTHIWVAVRFSA